MPWLFNVIPTILAMFNNPSWNIAKGLSNFNVHLCSLMISSFLFINLIYLSIFFPRSKIMLTPLKINKENLQKESPTIEKKNIWTNPPPFLGGSKMWKLSRVYTPQNQQKNPNKLVDLTYPGALQRQIPTSSSITNQHGLWDLFGDFWSCGKGKVEEYSCYFCIIIYRVIL